MKLMRTMSGKDFQIFLPDLISLLKKQSDNDFGFEFIKFYSLQFI